MEDRQIVDLYWQRSDLAISETNQKYGRYCHTIAYNICGTKEDAEECVSDTWFNRIKRGGGEAVLALDELEECIPGGTNPEQALEEKELARAVGRFVSELPKMEKKIFVLRYWYVASIDDIAKTLGFSTGKVKTSLFRTRKKLKNYLEEEGLC